MSMAYPKRDSNIKRKRAIGFRARMSTKAGRKLMNRKRRVGRSLNVRGQVISDGPHPMNV